MRLSDRATRWFAIRKPRTAASRALLIAQCAVQRKQVPLIYTVVILECLSIVYVLPSDLAPVLRFGVAGLLIAISLLRVLQWRRVTEHVDADTARRHLTKVRLLAGVLGLAFTLGTLIR